MNKLSKCKNLVYPSRVFARGLPAERITVTGSKAIEAIKKHLSPHGLRDENLNVLDVFPGHGTLSKALLEAGLPRIHLLHKFPVETEPTEEQLAMKESLDQLENQYKSRVHIHETGIFHYEDQHLADTISKIAPCEDWPSEPPLKVILQMSPHVEHRIINLLHHQIIDQSGLFTCLRPQLYIFMSYFQATVISADYKTKNYLAYRSKSVLYQTLFDVEFLEKIPWNQFSPEITLSKKFSRPKTNDYFTDYDHSYLVRVTPKKNLPDLISLDSLQEYHFFVTQALVRRKNYLIPWFEKWFPGCGPRLIKAGIPLFSKAGDTSPQTFVSLFNLITKWPEYTTSTFKAAAITHHLAPDVELDEQEDEDVLDSSGRSSESSENLSKT